MFYTISWCVNKHRGVSSKIVAESKKTTLEFKKKMKKNCFAFIAVDMETNNE